MPSPGQKTGIFEHKFIPLQLALASQIVSHILGMWRVINGSYDLLTLMKVDIKNSGLITKNEKVHP